jgi:hypothetical protein
MASPPRERDAALIANGLKLMLVAGAIVVIAVVVAISMEGTPAGIAVAVAALASVPLMAGVGMWVTGVVSRRSRAGKPFA